MEVLRLENVYKNYGKNEAIKFILKNLIYDFTLN